MHTMRQTAVGPQCPELFAQKTALRGKVGDAISIPDRLTTAPTLGGEARHG